MCNNATALKEVDAIDASDPARFIARLDSIRDFRGDVTLDLRDGATLEGFVFDVIVGGDLDSCALRLLVPGDATRRSVAGREIAAIRITGRDAAAGKSWENWVRRYAEKRRAGERASIESESLD
ncbi:MAG: hypothetical protein FJ254_07570 [Phycisphaerae bacterium]|nr:hypothetical protein [Phycisphaerae bacterium]